MERRAEEAAGGPKVQNPVHEGGVESQPSQLSGKSQWDDNVEGGFPCWFAVECVEPCVEGIQPVWERSIPTTERTRLFVVNDGLDAPPHAPSVPGVLKVLLDFCAYVAFLTAQARLANAALVSGSEGNISDFQLPPDLCRHPVFLVGSCGPPLGDSSILRALADIASCH